MISLITSGIEVEVFSSYLSKSSDPDKQQFIFGYNITLKNLNPFSVQLLTRHWYIYDSLAPIKQVKGKGVIGEQPILLPGESYTYNSFCELRSDIGWMEGNYLFQREHNNELLEVSIPRFELAAFSKAN
jgi:ApaG protein